MILDEEKLEILQVIFRKRQTYNCTECGKCSSVCPIARINGEYYPRNIIRKAVYGKPEMIDDGLLRTCLNCGRCDEVCEMDVKFYELIKDLRTEFRNWGMDEVQPPHNGGLHAWMQAMTSPGLKQDRLDWIKPDMKCSDKGDVLYFVGCLPYYDRFYTELNPNSLSIARSTVKILNALNIRPAVMKNERCCGHDFLWGGDEKNFEKLAQKNVEEIKRTEAKKIITSCAECYHTLKVEYPKYVAKMGVEVIHISELISENGSNFNFKKLDKKVIFQDPCRLGRLSGIYEEPRQALKAVEGIELLELEKNRSSAVCCGTSGWLSCGRYSKQIQTEKLKEAKKSGAELLITSCPKCQIHFKCALSDKKMENDSKIEVQDLTTLVSDCLQ